MKILTPGINILRGASMAAENSVPGVSGGNIAFILGFYEQFITSLNDFLLSPPLCQEKAISFLIALEIGWTSCFLICSSIISTLFDTHIYELSFLFLGLTLATIPIIYEERACLKGKYH